jgi:hypothetical protein
MKKGDARLLSIKNQFTEAKGASIDFEDEEEMKDYMDQ